MLNLNQQFASHWQLASGHTLRRVAGQPRLLRVAQGRLWVTRDGSLQAPAEDVLLKPGDSLALTRGEAVVLEAWGDSAFEWLEPAPALKL